MEFTSKFISWLFLPLLTPLYALLLLLFLPSDQDFFFNYNCLYTLALPTKYALIYLFTIFGFLAPGISLLVMYRTKMISNIEIDNKSERSIPIIIQLLYCLFLYLFFVFKDPAGQLPTYVYAFPLSGAIVTAIFFLLNRWKKISIHAAGTGIMTGMILAYSMHCIQYSFWIIPFSFIVSGLVMSARVYLHKHTLLEVIIGWLVGFLVTFGIVYLYK
ncbi:MAG: phosphatase PAP2 family protein [Bacteroidetes bacterium]|nr:MAG: phosphatase PAP2 family protein [Bacteroidota bacterium]TNE96452.1 MAG: phosphatase PAP2 family protein [Bacteroidota bacterium]